VSSEFSVAVVAALEREVQPVAKRWAARERDHDGRRFKFFENAGVALVCGGIGREAAARATKAAIALYQPELVISAGFAGALMSHLAAGEWVLPALVVDARDGSRVETDIAKTGLAKTAARHLVLVTTDEVVNPERKAVLARSYAAQAVDMEAAAVAQVTRAQGLHFLVVKAISDEAGFEMPPIGQFIGAEGDLNFWGLVAYAGPRFWLWPQLVRLARNSRVAAGALCCWLEDGVLWSSLVSSLLPKEVTTV